MKVFYHQMDGANVGDDMNAALWHKLVPDLDELASAQWLVGAGTIIDTRLDALPGCKIIMGAGVRPGARRAVLNDVRFAAVRGYHSAAYLGLAPETAACDPGFLVNRVWPQPTQARTRIGFVPHVYSEQYSSIAAAAADAGFEVISPQLPIETFLQRLAGCARVYSESLHGAIFADALRIPWARVCVCSIHYERSAVASFKWNDAFSVLGLRSAPIDAPALIPLKRSWIALRAGLRPVQALAEKRLVRSLLQRRDDERIFQLSDAARLDERIGMLANRVMRIDEVTQVERWPSVRRRTADTSHDAAIAELRVLAFPKQGENAYLASFATSLEDRGAVVDEFTFWRALLKRYDVVHMHWPDTHLRTHSWWRAIGKHIRLGGTCAVLRLRGTRIVWMMHNIKPHEKDHWISRTLFPLWFPRVCTHVMALTQKGLAAAHAHYLLLRSKPSIVVPHGHYRNVYPLVPQRSLAREKLGVPDRFTFLFFGSIRRYKNVPLLIETFRKLQASDVQLLVAGRPVLGMRAEDLQALAADDPRIHLHLKFIPDEQIPLYLAAADKVVAPFDAILNSGSVMLALSMNRSVMAPRLGALPELQAHVGRRWLHLYEGALSPELLVEAQEDPSLPAEHETADLSNFDWDVIARTTLHFYRHSSAPEPVAASARSALTQSPTP